MEAEDDRRKKDDARKSADDDDDDNATPSKSSMDLLLGDNEEGDPRSSGEGGSNNTQQKIWSLRDSSDEFAMFSFKIGARFWCFFSSLFLVFFIRSFPLSKFYFTELTKPVFFQQQQQQNSTVLASSRARLDGVSVRPSRGESEKTRFKDVFVHGDSVRGLSKSTREQHEGEREPRVFLSERCELSVRARCFRELATSESVSNAAV